MPGFPILKPGGPVEGGCGIQESRHGGNHRRHGEGTAREDRRADDGMQEGADRGRRRHGQGRGDPARSRAATRRARWPAASRPKASSAPAYRGGRQAGALVEVNCETDFVAKNEDFLALVAKLAELVAVEESGRCGGAVRRCPSAQDGGSRRAPGAGGQHRREPVDPALRADPGQGHARALPARRRQDRRAGGRGRRRRSAGQGPRDAHRRVQAGGAVQGRGARRS